MGQCSEAESWAFALPPWSSEEQLWLGPLQTNTAMAAAWEEPLGAKCVLLK